MEGGDGAANAIPVRTSPAASLGAAYVRCWLVNLIAELRRRNVLRAATFYAAAAWLLMQVATQVLPYFGIDTAVLRWFVLALVAGFPLAMLVAWFYEWTPDGLKREHEVAPEDSITVETGRKLNTWIIGVLSLIVVFLLVDTFMPRGDADAGMDKSIAVLPFIDSDNDGKEQYFSDGLSENLIIALTQFSGLKVISRNSSFQFRGNRPDSAAIGRKLGVAYLLEGSVRRAGGQVSINIELIKARDGDTLWSQRYQRPYLGLFALQEEITTAVATALQAELVSIPGAVPQSDHPPSGNLGAYNAYLQGEFYFQRRSEADYRKAIDAYEAAVRLDPNYALAYAGLTRAQTDLAGYYQSGNAALVAYAKARTASATALRLGPQLARVHAARGYLVLNADMDFATAETELRKALALAPNSSDVQSQLGLLLATLGHLNQAIALTRRSIESDPLYSEGYTLLAAFQSGLGQLDAAEQAIRKSIELQPGAGFERVQLAMIAIQRDDEVAATAAVNQVNDEGGWLQIAQAFVTQIGHDRNAADAALQHLIDTQADISAFQIAETYALRQQPDKVFEWLNAAYANRDPGINRIWFDPFILRYKADPRFIAFCRKVGLPETGEGVMVASLGGRPAAVGKAVAP